MRISLSPPHRHRARQSWRGCKAKGSQSCHPPVSLGGPMRSPVSQQSPTHRKREEGEEESGTAGWGKGGRDPSSDEVTVNLLLPCRKGTCGTAAPAERKSAPAACAHTAAWLSPGCYTSRLCSWCKVSDTPRLTPSPLCKQSSLENSISRASAHHAKGSFAATVFLLTMPYCHPAELVLSSSCLLNSALRRPIHLLAAGSMLEMPKHWDIRRFFLKFGQRITAYFSWFGYLCMPLFMYCVKRG